MGKPIKWVQAADGPAANSVAKIAARRQCSTVLCGQRRRRQAVTRQIADGGWDELMMVNE